MTKSSLGARIFARTSSNIGSGQSASRVPCTNRIGVRSARKTSSRTGREPSRRAMPTSG